MSFKLDRMYAYEVHPQKNQDQIAVPVGGAVRVTPQLLRVLENANKKIAQRHLTTVDFLLDESRHNDVRVEVMNICFGATNAPRAAIQRLATRLSEVMDNRSNSALLLAAVHSNDRKRRLAILVLPKEDVITMSGQDEDVELELREDTFSTQSGFRKVALLEGHNHRSQFLSIQILDLQLTSNSRSIADFWIKRFLLACPRMDSNTGTRLLAEGLQRSFRSASDDEQRDGVLAAMLKLSSGAVRRTSLEKYAQELPVSLRGPLLQGATAEVRQVVFDVDRTQVKADFGIHIFTDADGVILHAPAKMVGKSVKISKDGNKRSIRYSGKIEKERVTRVRSGSREVDSTSKGAARGDRSATQNTRD